MTKVLYYCYTVSVISTEVLMSKKSQAEAAWGEDVAKLGLKAVIADRLEFHGGFQLMFVVRYTGCAQNTAKKHLNRLVKEGVAVKELHGNELRYRHTPKP